MKPETSVLLQTAPLWSPEMAGTSARQPSRSLSAWRQVRGNFHLAGAYVVKLLALLRPPSKQHE